MSFRFSVGDIIATAQLCRSVIAETLSGKLDSSNSSPRAIQVLKRLRWSLDRLADGLTSSESSKVLAQESFQQPLREMGFLRSDVTLRRFQKPQGSKRVSDFRRVQQMVGPEEKSK